MNLAVLTDLCLLNVSDFSKKGLMNCLEGSNTLATSNRDDSFNFESNACSFLIKGFDISGCELRNKNIMEVYTYGFKVSLK